MNSTDILQNYFSGLWPQAPTLIAGFVAVILVAVKWQRGVSLWALLGFMIPLGMALLVPLVYALLPQWTRALSGKDITTVYQCLAVLWSLLACASYVLLLLAVLSRRQPAAR